MFFSPATLALVALLSFIGFSPSGVAAPARHAAAPRTLAAGKLWAPKKSRAASEADTNARIAREEEVLLRPRNAPAAPPPRPHKKIKMEAAASEEEAEAGDDEEEDRPSVYKRHKSSDEDDDDEDDDEGPESFASVAPHVVTFGIGTSFLHRTFSYDTPLQGDNGFRLGYAFALESYPLLGFGPGWQRTIGLGFQFASEILGSAGIRDSGNGALVSYPVKQGRWGVDLRYALALGERVVLVPALGYGKLSVDLRRPTPLGPSMCTPGTSPPCFGDVSSSHLTADLHTRIAFTPGLAASLTVGVHRGLNVSRAMGGIAAEVPASSNGFHVEPGMTLMLGDWFALQATVPILRNSYRFGAPASGNRSYSSATETYYGVVFGVAAMVY